MIDLIRRLRVKLIHMRTNRWLAFVFMCIVCPTHADSTSQPTIAIIIDDMGNHYDSGVELINMPYPLTLAFLPERRFTQKLVKKAKYHGKEIMLHAPMENVLGIGLGKGALTSTMNEQEIKTTLTNALFSIPGAVGLNNHMGSKLTTNSKAMRWIMEQISKQPFYFVDSRTSAQSVAAEMADQFGVPNLSRDVFLDHHQTPAFVQKQFLKLIDIARKKGTAIAIGHPHSVTIDYLQWALPKLDEKGIRIATISQLWHIKNPSKQMYAHRKQASRMTLARHTADIEHDIFVSCAKHSSKSEAAQSKTC